MNRLLSKIRENWLRILVHVGGLLPLGLTLWDYWQGAFFIDPIREITTRTGRTALVLLVLSLACTPINILFGFRRVMQVRRALGLYAFLYVSVHFIVFAAWDYGLDLRLLGPAIFSQRFVLPGLAAGLLLLPLVITSPRGFQRRMGGKWKWLHRLAYVAAILAVLHLFWLVKAPRRPLLYGAVLTLLLLVRLPIVRKTFIKLRRGLSEDTLGAKSLPALETKEDLTVSRP